MPTQDEVISNAIRSMTEEEREILFAAYRIVERKIREFGGLPEGAVAADERDAGIFFDEVAGAMIAELSG